MKVSLVHLMFCLSDENRFTDSLNKHSTVNEWAVVMGKENMTCHERSVEISSQIL